MMHVKFSAGWLGPMRVVGFRRRNKDKNGSKSMRGLMMGLAGLVLSLGPAWADLAGGLDAWSEGDFETAMEELVPAAAEGDADAQELIGVLYALGLGVEQDRAKAFEWYLISAENGHAGAQSGVGWYYEVGLGGVPIDLVKAHTWYAVSAVGGDVDAAVSVTEVEKKMTRAEISAAQQEAAAILGRQ